MSTASPKKSTAAVRTPAQKAEAARLAAETANANLRTTIARARTAALKKALAKQPRAAGMMGAAGSYSTERTRLRDGTVGRGGSADYHLDPLSLRDLRKDGQKALRMDPLARSIVKALNRLVIGSGPTMRPQTGDEDFNTRAGALLAAWCTNNYDEAVRLGYAGTRAGWGCDAKGLVGFDALLRQTVRGCVSDGQVLVSITATDGAGGGGKITLIEAERFMGPDGMYAPPSFRAGQGGWINGIELDGGGMAVRVGVAPWNMTLNMPRWSAAELEYVSLVDGTAMLFRNPLDEAVNQTSGEPALAATLPKLDMLRELDTSVVAAADIQAKITAVFSGPSPGMLAGDLPGVDVSRTASNLDGTSAGASSSQVRELEPGTGIDAGPDTKVNFPPPTQPIASYGDFCMLQWGLASVDAAGIPIMLALMDPRNANYSGFRAAIGLCWENIDLWRQELSRLIVFIATFKIAQWIRSGILDFPALTDEEMGETEPSTVEGAEPAGEDAAEEMTGAETGEPEMVDPAERILEWRKPVRVTWNPMPSLDPAKDVAGLAAAEAAGMASRSENIAKWSGRDRVEVDRERREDAASEMDIPQRVPLPGAAVQKNQSSGGEKGANNDGAGDKAATGDE